MEFECARGSCTVDDEFLTIEQPAPEKMTRWNALRIGLSTSWDHQPRKTIKLLGKPALLVLIFIGLLSYLHTQYVVETSVMVGLSILGIVALIGPLEMAYRQARQKRRTMKSNLANNATLTYPDRIPLEEIIDVNIEAISGGNTLIDGHLLVVKFNKNGTIGTTYLGFPEFMSEELDAAVRAFEQEGIVLTAETRSKPTSSVVG